MELKNDHDFVQMPWDKTADLHMESERNSDQISRWDYIQIKLDPTKPINSADHLVETIKSYNVIQDADGIKHKPHWKCSALLQYFEEIDEVERDLFFSEGGVLESIRNLALRSPELVNEVKLLKSGFKSSVNLHQLQIASLLANAFLCTYPKRSPNYPSINFNTLFEGSDTGNNRTFIEKIKCIIHYFKRISEKQPTGNVSFHRLCIPSNNLPRWDKTTASLCKLQVEIQGKIEDQNGYLQMDFANRFVGGGVLGRGCVQEEIRFVICPELIAARLFTQCLADNEALLVVGAERYCKYTGFANTFRFDGDFRDITPFDEYNYRKTNVIVLDALYFNHSSEQYRESNILRELKKAYVGFKPIGNSAIPLATGNWGCGAFRGDPQLKSILQLMASSQAQRDVLYLTFGNLSLKKQIDNLYQLLKDCNINVGTLYRIIRLYRRNRNKNQTLFDFITDTITPTRNQIMEPFYCEDMESNSKNPGTTSWKQRDEVLSLADFNLSMETPQRTLTSCTSIDQKSGKDTSVVLWSERCETEGAKYNNQNFITEERESHSNVFFTDEMRSQKGLQNDTRTTKVVEMQEASSPSLLSSLDIAVSESQSAFDNCTYKSNNSNTTRLVSSNCGLLFESNDGHRYIKAGGGQLHKLRKEHSCEEIKAKTRRLVQSKITDCFKNLE